MMAKHLPTLDGLRAVAVGIVMLSHVAHSGGAPHWLGQPAPLLTGEVGVLILFTIRGFIITHLLLRERAKQGRINLKSGVQSPRRMATVATEMKELYRSLLGQ